MWKYIVYAWLVIVNLFAFVIYRIDGLHPEKRMKEWLMLLLPVLGGGLGACLGNYFYSANVSHAKALYWRLLHYWPGFFFLFETAILLPILCGQSIYYEILRAITKNCTAFGYYLLLINAVAMVLQFIRGSEFHWKAQLAPGISVTLLGVIILIGGAPGALVIELLFNSKFYCRESFWDRIVYGYGIWIPAIIWGYAILAFVFSINPLEPFFATLFNMLYDLIKKQWSNILEWINNLH